MEIRIVTVGKIKEKYLCDGSMSGAGGDGILRDRPGRGKTRSDQEAHDGGAEKGSKKGTHGQHERQTDLSVRTVDEGVLCSVPDRSP